MGEEGRLSAGEKAAVEEIEETMEV